MVLKYLFYYMMKYSKQISMLFIKKTLQEHKNNGENVRSNALLSNLFAILLKCHR